jgi:hypothetical protein
MGETQRRKGERTGEYRRRDATASRAATATHTSKEEDQWAPWKRAWEKESGKKYGIGTHSEFMGWINEKRKERESKAAPKKEKKKEPSSSSGSKKSEASSEPSAQQAGDAMAEKKESESGSSEDSDEKKKKKDK